MSSYVQLSSSEDHVSISSFLRTTFAHAHRRLFGALKGKRMGNCSLKTIPHSVATSFTSSANFYRQNLWEFQREILCGIAATLLQVPETVAFSYVANLDPVVGLYATGFFGIVVGLFGGVPATIAGAAGALGVVMPTITSATGTLQHLTYDERVEHLFMAVFLAGLLQLVFGILELSRFFSMIPHTAHIGFLNGLALMMLFSQKTTFMSCSKPNILFGACEQNDDLVWMSSTDPSTWATVFTTALTIVIMHWFPRIPYVGRIVPPTLAVAVVSVCLEHGINRPLLGYNVRTIGDTSPLAGALPKFKVPRFGNIADWSLVVSVAASLAAVGIFESIMTLQAIVDLTKSKLSRAACRKECLAQGIGNILCGVFQGMGGCSMIGQSTGNVLNGGRHRVSGVVCGIVTFAVLLFASPAIELVPVACLTGILVVIIAHTFHWPSLRMLIYLPIVDAFAIVLVTVLAALTNLAIAVIVGVLWQSVVNGWNAGHHLTVEITNEDIYDGKSPNARVYQLKGSLLYSSIVCFRDFFDIADDPPLVVIDVQNCRVTDFSAVAALKEIATRYRDQEKHILIRHLDAYAMDLLLHHDYGWELVDDESLQLAIDNFEATPSPIASYHGLQ
ncbi:Sulfate Permease (SulP) Family [Thraustotheca clavata]|uniref:Sulfate Permease (SulP) Family n=1 Tax=Thraustotheca clavata TaxID=74557 RepID=A0A1V9Y8R3_9STRA|nr:Sulfate Permease (SulP) Family [Thraustotheca clavata]